MNSVYRRPSLDGKTMVTIFRTNVVEWEHAQFIVNELTGRFPGAQFTFDLLDSDRVFRLESAADIGDEVVRFVKGQGFMCELL